MAELRPAEVVMRLARLGSMHQCRLSFMRQLTRRMAREAWSFAVAEFEIDGNGVGHAVYVANSPTQTYSLVVFSHDLPDELRSDRVIATVWDATFALFDGIPESDDIERLAQNVPVQEAGRLSERELVLSRANRSTRMWKYIIESLSQGKQPDLEVIESVGYLMRTTAVYGSGKFGVADRESIAARPEFHSPFQAEMLLVYLARTFVRDLANHIAKAKGGKRAVKLDPNLAVKLGIGNSTGLGMAPFIVNHPLLFNNWILAREEAILRVRSLNSATESELALFKELLVRARLLVDKWESSNEIQQVKIANLREDLHTFANHLQEKELPSDNPWDSLMSWTTDNLGVEAQEFVASLILEPYSDLVDSLATSMSDNNSDAFVIDGEKTVGQIKQLIRGSFDWAFNLNWQDPQTCARVWYVSEEKLEPRLGERFEEPVADYEQPLSPARDAVQAYENLAAWDEATPVSKFLAKHPEHRHTIRRAQISEIAPYGEIRDNTIASDLLPVDLLRVKLSFFGATHFDPKSDRWIRICMYSGAPYPEDLTVENSDLWVYPEAA